MEENCHVCTELFTLKVRKKIECFYCDLKVCLKCYKTYLSDVKDFKNFRCMGCRVLLTDNDLEKMFPKKFLDKFIILPAKKQNLEERRKTLFFEIQPLMVNDKMNKIYNVKNDFSSSNIFSEKNILKCKDPKLLKKLILDTLILLDPQMNDSSVRKVLNTHRPFKTIPCPGGNCKGLITHSQRCSVCEKLICYDCLSFIKSLDHKCSKDNKESVSILKNTKQCPNCGISIVRAEGCDQMFCTHCKAKWNYSSGQIISSDGFHNPEYNRYLNSVGKGGRPLGDIVCGQELTDNVISKILNKVKKSVRNDLDASTIINRINYVENISSIHILRVQEERLNFLEKEKKLLAYYETDRIPYEECINDLYDIYKIRNKLERKIDILESYRITLTDAIYKVIEENAKCSDLLKISGFFQQELDCL